MIHEPISGQFLQDHFLQYTQQIRISPDFNHQFGFEILTTELCEAVSLLPVTWRSLSQMATCHFEQQILYIFRCTPCQTPFPDASMSDQSSNQFL